MRPLTSVANRAQVPDWVLAACLACCTARPTSQLGLVVPTIRSLISRVTKNLIPTIAVAFRINRFALRTSVHVLTRAVDRKYRCWLDFRR